jgi:ATP-dependent Clp protease adaptor protein ClpS
VSEKRENDVSVAEPKTTTTPKLKEAPLYKVVLHNDDYTPRDFVVIVLAQIFMKNEGDATSIMIQAHNNGWATVGLYTFEIAEAKVAQAMRVCKEAEFPLLFTVEPE